MVTGCFWGLLMGSGSYAAVPNGGRILHRVGLRRVFTCTPPPPTFLHLPPPSLRYAAMLADKMAQHGTTAWLINTGWTGGKWVIGIWGMVSSSGILSDSADHRGVIPSSYLQPKAL